jgi:hypothetical protein
MMTGCSVVPFCSSTSSRGGKLVFFSCYTATNVFLPPQSAGVLWASTSSSVPHFLILVATFVHLCEMFICVPPSVTLFSLFHMP